MIRKKSWNYLNDKLFSNTLVGICRKGKRASRYLDFYQSLASRTNMIPKWYLFNNDVVNPVFTVLIESRKIIEEKKQPEFKRYRKAMSELFKRLNEGYDDLSTSDNGREFVRKLRRGAYHNILERVKGALNDAIIKRSGSTLAQKKETELNYYSLAFSQRLLKLRLKEEGKDVRARQAGK